MSLQNALTGMVDSSTEKGNASDSDAPDFTAVKERIFGGRAKPSKRKSPKQEQEELTAKELEQIFAGENWEELSALYFNARFSITGFDGFLLTDGQKKTLGTSLGTTMKMLLKIDPGYIAMLVFLSTFGGIIAEKEITYKTLKDRANKKVSHGADPKPS